MASRSQLDLLVNALVLIRKASSAIDAALRLPAADRAQLEGTLDAVRHDLSHLVSQIGGQIPGAAGLGRRPEVKMAAGVVEFLARQGAAQLGVVAGMADTLRQGADSRSLADRIAVHLAEHGVASRQDLAESLGFDPGSPRLQEALERALGSGRAEWYGPDVYGVPRGQLEQLAERERGASAGATDRESDQPESEAEPGVDDGEPGEDAAEPDAGDEPRDLNTAVSELETSLAALSGALRDTESGERSGAEQIRDLRRLADEGVISEREFERKKRDILERM